VAQLVKEITAAVAALAAVGLVVVVAEAAAPMQLAE
jgi:hypothetical protein